jgi:hypothetical protein
VAKGSDVTAMAHAIQETANQLYACHGNEREPWRAAHTHLTAAARLAWERDRSGAYIHLCKAFEPASDDRGLADAINAHIEDLNKTKARRTMGKY